MTWKVFSSCFPYKIPLTTAGRKIKWVHWTSIPVAQLMDGNVMYWVPGLHQCFLMNSRRSEDIQHKIGGMDTVHLLQILLLPPKKSSDSLEVLHKGHGFLPPGKLQRRTPKLYQKHSSSLVFPAGSPWKKSMGYWTRLQILFFRLR